MSAEVIYAIREEMALRMTYIVFRRTGFGTAACPSLSRLEALADITGRDLGWDSKRKFDEISAVLRRYSPLQVPIDCREYSETENFANASD
jgi:glycerol-3-phosphate dehydrogenase